MIAITDLSCAGGYALRKRLLLAVTLIVNLLVVNLYSVKVYADEVDVIHVGGSLTADELLMKMERNTRALTYQGTLVYAQGRHMETLKLFHKLKDGKQFERLVHLTGMPREILRRGDKVICVHPKNGVVELNNTVPAGPFARNYKAQLSSVNEPYSVQLAGQGRVAGRDVALLAVQPKDAYRYGYRLALDKETGLLLQSLMVNGKGKVLERFEYTEIKFGGPITDQQLLPQVDSKREQLSLFDANTGQRIGPAGAKAVTSPDENSSKNWQVGWLPAGFAMSSARRDPEAGAAANKQRDSLMYSDGLTAFSVFIAPDVDMSKIAVQSGATTAYTAVKKDRQGVYSVTVVGEIPRLAAKNIASSVTRKLDQ